jgi:hypothetical protein
MTHLLAMRCSMAVDNAGINVPAIVNRPNIKLELKFAIDVEHPAGATEALQTG